MTDDMSTVEEYIYYDISAERNKTDLTNSAYSTRAAARPYLYRRRGHRSHRCSLAPLRAVFYVLPSRHDSPLDGTIQLAPVLGQSRPPLGVALPFSGQKKTPILANRGLPSAGVASWSLGR